MNRYFLILILLISNSTCYSQTLKFESIEINNISKIIPSTKKYIQYVENSDGTINFVSLLTREIQKISYDNKNAFLIIQKYQSLKGINIDSSYVDAVNLKPLAYHTDISSEGYRESVTFSKDQIINRIFYADSISNVITSNNQFYNGVITSDLISELPLKVGEEFKINMVNPGKRFYDYVTTVKVLDIETLELNSFTKVKCWKLNVNHGSSNKGTTEWYSLDGQIQIKSLFELDNGNRFIRTMVIK